MVMAIGAVFERTFDQPGYYRLSLTVHNGALAGLAWRDLLVVRPPPGVNHGARGTHARSEHLGNGRCR